MAYYVPDCFRGLDLLIPIQHTSKKYGTLRVQVKNYSNKINKGDCTGFLKKLHPSECPPQVDDERLCVGLVLSVNDIHKSIRSEPSRNAKGHVLQLVTCFPMSPSPLDKLSQNLKAICSLNTAQTIFIDRFAEEGMLRGVDGIKNGQSA